MNDSNVICLPIPLSDGRIATLTLPIKMPEADFERIVVVIAFYLDNFRPVIVRQADDKT